MEHIVHSHLMKFLESNRILSDHQHGFRKRRSCETQLLITVHDLAAGLDRRQQIDAILLDFSKAFDIVPHQRLAAKLHHYGFRDQTLSWIKSFLADRSQQVVLDGKSSSRPGFRRAQSSVLSCSWFTSTTCPQESPLQYDCLPTTVCCIEWSKTIKTQGCCRPTLISFKSGNNICQVLFQWLQPNQQCHFNDARTRMGGSTNKKATAERGYYDVQDRQEPRWYPRRPVSNNCRSIN